MYYPQDSSRTSGKGKGGQGKGKGGGGPTKSPSAVDVDPAQTPTRSPSGIPSGIPTGTPSDIPSGIPTGAGAGGADCAPVTYDGVTYDVVLIGDQCWTTQNLRTTKYADGTPIKKGNNGAVWKDDTEGATVFYVNKDDEDTCSTCQALCWYGRLYNWYAVNNAKGLCAPGWRVPSDQDWTKLETYVKDNGFSGNEGLALRGNETCHWRDGQKDPANLGTNDFGLTIVGQGFRFDSGPWSDTGAEYGIYWTSTAASQAGWAFNRFFTWKDIVQGVLYVGAKKNLVNRMSLPVPNSPEGSVKVNFGLYVRCMKDAN